MYQIDTLIHKYIHGIVELVHLHIRALSQSVVLYAIETRAKMSRQIRIRVSQSLSQLFILLVSLCHICSFSNLTAVIIKHMYSHNNNNFISYINTIYSTSSSSSQSDSSKNIRTKKEKLKN